jgi:hypothetical protein
MDIEKWQSKRFEDIKHFDEDGNEYWLARELQAVLDYAKWQRFRDVLDRVVASCKMNEQEPSYHFADAGKMFSAMDLKFDLKKVTECKMCTLTARYKKGGSKNGY